MSYLEYFLPEVIGEIHPECLGRSCDGILPSITLIIAPRTIHILGLYCEMSSQTWHPLDVRFQIAPIADTINWMECKLGERFHRGSKQTTLDGNRVTQKRTTKFLYNRENIDIDWFYRVTFGTREE